MIACSVQEVSKMLGGNYIFEQISFDIRENDRVGLVGRNGSGKTTLLKLLAGEEQPDSGAIHWRKQTQIGYVQQIPNFDQQLLTADILKESFSALLELAAKMTVIEQQMGTVTDETVLTNLMSQYSQLQEQFIENDGYYMDVAIEKVVEGLQLQPLLEKEFASLSGGERTKVGLAYMLLKQPNFLLLDEPTNHLDLAAVDWLTQFLRNYKGTVVIVSHDRYFLDEMVTTILDMDEGMVEQYHTNYSNYVVEKEARLLQQFEDYKEQQKKIKKMKEAIKRLKEWANRANPPNEGLHKRARNMERALERMEKIDRPVLERKKMNLTMEAADRSGKDVIVVKGLEKNFGARQLFAQVDMHVRYQQRVAIVGNNGTGKSTLIKLMLQQLVPDAGEVRLGSNVKVGYLSQHVLVAEAGETIIDVFRKEIAVTEGEARQILAKFLFYGHSVFKKAAQLSGGEKMRLRLAQLMYQDTNLLILDEPTNHLDIESLEVLEDTLEDYNGTILAVSHDRYFLNKIFDYIYWLREGKVHGFAGNYNWAKGQLERLE